MIFKEKKTPTLLMMPLANGWRAVQPFLDAWANDGEVHEYPAGEDGPEAGNELLTRDRREWHRLG